MLFTKTIADKPRRRRTAYGLLAATLLATLVGCARTKEQDKPVSPNSIEEEKDTNIQPQDASELSLLDMLKNEPAIFPKLLAETPELIYDADILQAALEGNYTNACAVFRLYKDNPERGLQDNKEFILNFLKVADPKYKPFIFRDASERLRKDAEVRTVAMPYCLSAYWSNIAKNETEVPGVVMLRETLEEFPPSSEFIQRCVAARERLAEFGITGESDVSPGSEWHTVWQRIVTIEDAEHIIEQRTALETKKLAYSDRPLVVMFMPVFDGNGAFAAANGISSIIGKGNRLLYFEVNTENDFYSYLKLLQNNLPRRQKIIMIIGGHGTPDSTRFGLNYDFIDFYNERRDAISYYPADEESTLDFTDYVDDAKQLEPLHRLNIEKVFFKSCGTGQGKDNQAKRFAGFLPENVLVTAPVEDSQLEDFLYDLKGCIVGIRYNVLAYTIRGTLKK
jgi:hypothetical protein